MPALRLTGRMLLFGWAAALASPGALAAQVGLRSGLAQVVLVARASSRGTIDSIGAPAELRTSGSIREVSVPVRLSANTAYRLTVIRSDAPDTSARVARAWVRTESGEFAVLGPGSAVLVSRGEFAAAEGVLEVLYRLEGADPAVVPPVRYEIRLSPQL